MTILVSLHILAAVVWVGGMFFAYSVLRPSTGPLPPAERLALWHRTLRRFFLWVWASITVLLVSGYGMLFGYSGGRAGLHVHFMQATGILMMLLFVHLFFAPWHRFCHALEEKDMPQAAKSLDQIRRIVGINLMLGLLTMIVGASGRFW